MPDSALAASAFSPFLVAHADVERLHADFATVGAAVLGPLAVEEQLLAGIAREAQEQRRSSAWRLPSAGHESVANQVTVRAQLGPLTRQLMAAGATRSLIQAVTGRLVLPDWGTSCFTYYDEPGSWLGFHCDNPISCTVAFLFYIEAAWPGTEPGEGLQLHVCSRSTPEDVILRVTGHPGRLILLNGAEQAHGRPPLDDGESLVLLSGCYRTIARA